MFLFVIVAASAFDIVNSALDLALIRGHPGLAAGTHLLWSENRNLLAAAVWLLIGFPGSVIAFSVWLYFVYRNLQPLGLRPAMSPGMATGWLYVPVANFWKPLAVVGELWTKLTGLPSGWLLRGWWFSFWAGCIAGIIQMQASLRETDQASRVGPLLLSFPSDVLFIVTAALLVRIVLTLTAAEERLAGVRAAKEKTPPWG